MNAINQLFYKTGFTHDDAGPTNIAKDQSGRIVFHDLGPNVNKSFNARSALDRIHQNREKLGLPNLIEV
jgi:predicted unusual protein kinase regulating ubiquinone biosynthesis (AarF/ABC1/UbiB family)